MGYLLKYMKKYRVQAIIGPCFKIVESLLELCTPLVMASIIDNGIVAKDLSYVLNKGLVMVGISLLGYACSNVCQYFASFVSQASGAQIRLALFKHIQSLSYKEIDEQGTASFITILTSDINNVETAIAKTIRTMSRAPFIIIGSTILAIKLNPSLSITFIIASFFIGLSIGLITYFLQNTYKQVQQDLEQLTLIIRENLEGLRVIRANASQAKENIKFYNQSLKQRDQNLKAGKLQAILNPMTTLIINIAIILILYQGGIKINLGQMTQGEMIAYISYLTNIISSMTAFSNTLLQIIRGNTSAKRIKALFLKQSSLIAGTQTKELSNFNQIEVKEISFSYQEHEFIQNMSFTIHKNEMIGIIGTTGSGKSTLGMLLCRFYDVKQGEILIDGLNVKKYDFESLKKKILMVSQEPILYHGTLRKNMQWANENATDLQIYEALEIAQAKDFVDKLPQGLDTLIYQGGKNLSGGQRQRLTIARAIIGKPDILILDDSSSALDTMTEKALRRALTKLDCTLIIISQKVSSVKEANRIFVLEHGSLLAQGTHQQLYQQCSIYHAICDSQGMGGN